jgi:hypothetical protein
MAQTRRRRRTKHRGNAAGAVEQRGRTGRKLTKAEMEASQDGNRSKTINRYDRPPTWRSSSTRAFVATLIFFAAMALLLKQPLQASASLTGLMLVLYVPLTYYTDLWLYRRRQRQKANSSEKST